MDIIKVECENCDTNSLIKEEVLVVSGEKNLEDAYCPECEEKIFEGQTDGWFSVKKVDLKTEEDKDCTYPMA
jgi:Zn finger protein HypA/HybF involved in hydrogenase expression